MRQGLGTDDDHSEAADASSFGDGDAGGGAAQPATSADGGPADKGLSGAGPEVCSDTQIPALSQTPEILIVVDRSGSMRTLGVDRWGPSTAAVSSIVSTLEPQVHFGLMTFPADCLTLTDPNAQVACLAQLGALDQSLSCEPGRVDVPIGASNAQAIGSALSNTQPSGATPTSASVKAASDALNALPTDKTTGSRSILLVTDGAPNCSLGVGGLWAIGVSSSNGQPEAVTQTVASISSANTTGVRTWVIGYQTDNDAFLRDSLDQMASAGGTGEKVHRKVEDQASLVNTLRDLTQHALLCEVKLDQPVTDTSRLRVILQGMQLAAEPVNGYTLGADLQTVSLHGVSCDALRLSNGKVAAHAQILCPVPPVPDAGAPPQDDGPPPGTDQTPDAGAPPGDPIAI